MNKQNYKILIIVTPCGITSVTVNAADEESRIKGYNVLKSLEKAFCSINSIVSKEVDVDEWKISIPKKN